MGRLRASHRELDPKRSKLWRPFHPHTRSEPLIPNEPYELAIEIWPTSNLFKAGHRIRLYVSSSNFPRFDVNPNTGEPLNANRRRRIAENAVYHDADHPSHIVLPVIPAR